MKVVLAPDKFRGLFSAQEVADCLAQGLRQALPKATLVVKPVFDGGEGTAENMAGLMSMEARSVACENISGQSIQATIHWLGERRLALVESSQVLRTPLPWTRADFMRSSSWVLGKLLLKALELRPKDLWLTCGGTLTADAGWGLASCFGVDGLDAQGKVLEPTVAHLNQIAKIQLRSVHRVVERTTLTVLCDVNAPLVAPGGVSMRTFLTQKGALTEDEDGVMQGAQTFREALATEGFSVLPADAPFGGAAGGLAIGLSALGCPVALTSGAQHFIRLAALRPAMADADLVICGEGRLDESTLYGKSPFAVAHLARELHVPAVGVFGEISDPRLCEALGLQAWHVMDNRPLEPSKHSDERWRDRVRKKRQSLVALGRTIGLSWLESQSRSGAAPA